MCSSFQMFADLAHFVHLSHAHHFVGLYSFTEDDTSGNVFDPDSYQRDNTIKGVSSLLLGIKNFYTKY